LFYGKVAFQPNNYLFNNEGDAIKNYFTYCYHIKHDVSYLNFQGMNYPYGEHILYTDCHPVFAIIFKFLSSKIEFFSNYSIGILNFLMILSIFLTFIVCYFLLKEFKINNWFSLLFSIGITMLSPQIFRLGGHLSLSYSIAIPLSWLLIIISSKNTKNICYTFLLFINNLFWIFIHAYLGIIILFFLTLIVIGNYISDKQRMTKIVHYFQIISAIFFPIVIFYLLSLLTDTHTGRTDNPSGFFLYNAEFDDIFLPNHPPLRTFLDSLTGNIIKQQWEAWSYVGITTTIVFLFLIIFSIAKIIKRDRISILNDVFSSSLLNISLISAFIVLLFAMAFPFKQFPNLINYFTFLKQFRATGRFTWPFYFVSMVFAASFFREIYSRSLKQGIKYFVLTICILAGIFNIIEGLPYHIETSENLVKSSNIFKKEYLSPSYQAAVKSINPTSFQAIITLPFYYQGSESFSRPRNNETVRASIIMSYHTGIPVICANLTRTSIWESKNIVQIISPSFYKKNIMKDMHDKRPFLVIRTRDLITKYEEGILQKCNIVYSSDEISIYSISRDELFRNNARTILNKYFQDKPSLFSRESFYLSDNSSFFFYDGFEGLKSDKPFRGKGGFQSIKKGTNTLAEFPPNTFSPVKKYHVSIWMFNGIKDALNLWFRLMVEEYDKENRTYELTTIIPEQSEVIYGNWSLVEGSFQVKNTRDKVHIVTKGQNDSKAAFFADDLLVKEESTDVYKLNKIGDTLFYNNHDVIPLKNQ
jgi:hypothetical protein